MQTEKRNGPLARAESKSFQTGQANRNNPGEQSQPINPINLMAERSVLGALIEDDGLWE